MNEEYQAVVVIDETGKVLQVTRDGKPVEIGERRTYVVFVLPNCPDEPPIH